MITGRSRRGRARAPHACTALMPTVALIALVAHLAGLGVDAATISGCTINDVTSVVEACDVATTVVDLQYRSIKGFEADAFPAGSALTEL